MEARICTRTNKPTGEVPREPVFSRHNHLFSSGLGHATANPSATLNDPRAHRGIQEGERECHRTDDQCKVEF